MNPTFWLLLFPQIIVSRVLLRILGLSFLTKVLYLKGMNVEAQVIAGYFWDLSSALNREVEYTQAQLWDRRIQRRRMKKGSIGNHPVPAHLFYLHFKEKWLLVKIKHWGQISWFYWNRMSSCEEIQATESSGSVVIKIRLKMLTSTRSTWLVTSDAYSLWPLQWVLILP